MNTLIDKCIEVIRDNSAVTRNAGIEDPAPLNPSIVVNYNLDNNKFENYKSYMKQLWPKFHLNLEYASAGDDLGRIENNLRTNKTFNQFHKIHIHFLCNFTVCDIQDVLDYIKSRFHEIGYEVILHAFFDYEEKKNTEENEKKLIQLIKTEDGVYQYLFVFSNYTNSGAKWIREEEMKLVRLSSNITALMMNHSSYFDDGRCYTFSYNILEKPTRKIVQFCMRRLLECLSDYEVVEKLEKVVENKFWKRITDYANEKLGRVQFCPEDFQYLPSNHLLQKESKSTRKSLQSFEALHPVAAACFNAMLLNKKNAIGKMSFDNIEYSQELDEILSFSVLKGYLSKPNHDVQALYGILESRLLHDTDMSKDGKYFDFLSYYGNEVLRKELLEKSFAVFKEQLLNNIDRANDIARWIEEAKDSDCLIINAPEAEINLDTFYGKIIDDYFHSRRNDIIAQFDKCKDMKDFRNCLEKSLLEIFKENDIFYKAFEEEIDERVAVNTARQTFEQISLESNVQDNVCFPPEILQLEIARNRTNDVILLINPESSLLDYRNTDNYHKWTLSRQDCIERIDFHTLEYKGE